MPIGTRWIYLSNGNSFRTSYRSRLVAEEVKVDIRPELFAATPPTGWLRMLLSRVAEKDNQTVLFAGVSRAYVYAKVVCPTFMKPPAKEPGSGEEGLVGKLTMSMYGVRDAAQNLAVEYTSTLARAG